MRLSCAYLFEGDAIMPRPLSPFTTPRRADSKTYQVVLNPACGLPHRVCAEWQRRSFQDLPDELAHHRNPKNKGAARTAALALIEYLKPKLCTKL